LATENMVVIQISRTESPCIVGAWHSPTQQRRNEWPFDRFRQNHGRDRWNKSPSRTNSLLMLRSPTN